MESVFLCAYFSRYLCDETMLIHEARIFPFGSVLFCVALDDGSGNFLSCEQHTVMFSKKSYHSFDLRHIYSLVRSKA